MKFPIKIPSPPNLLPRPFDAWRNRVDGAVYQARRLQRLVSGLFPDPSPNAAASGLTLAGGRTLMSFGLFVFGLESIAPDGFQRSRSWRHASTDRFLARPARQFAGPGEDVVTLYGSLIPEIAGSFGAIDQLAEMAGTGDPQPLVDGAGRQWGEFVLVKLDETGSNIIAGGIPRRVDFTIELQRTA